jgi:hypothetical protein
VYYDLLVGDGGWWAHNDADLLLQALDSRLTVGVRWSTSKAFGSRSFVTESFARSIHGLRANRREESRGGTVAMDV